MFCVTESTRRARPLCRGAGGTVRSCRTRPAVRSPQRTTAVLACGPGRTEKASRAVATWAGEAERITELSCGTVKTVCFFVIPLFWTIRCDRTLGRIDSLVCRAVATSRARERLDNSDAGAPISLRAWRARCLLGLVCVRTIQTESMSERALRAVAARWARSIHKRIRVVKWRGRVGPTTAEKPGFAQPDWRSQRCTIAMAPGLAIQAV